MLRKSQPFFFLFIVCLPLIAWATPCSAKAIPVPPTLTARDAASVVFADRSVTTASGEYRFQVFVPAHWNGRRPVPVVLFLHGSGERGDDNRAQTKNGIRLLIGQNAETFPCIVVAPQCRAGASWNDGAMQEQALAALDQSIKEFNGDISRVYLSGLSMGGYGTWDLAQKYPERWAAIAPCCGGVRLPRPAGTTGASPVAGGAPVSDPYRTVAQKAASLHAWIFHGDADPVVPVADTRSMAAALTAAGSDVRLHVLAGIGHVSWEAGFADPKLPAWLFSQRRR